MDRSGSRQYASSFTWLLMPPLTRLCRKFPQHAGHI
jgi:hypothetical protein